MRISASPFRDGNGGTRFLTPDELYFALAEDFHLVPEIVSRSQCRVLIYNTIGNNPEFAEAFHHLHVYREELKQTKPQSNHNTVAKQESHKSLQDSTFGLPENPAKILKMQGATKREKGETDNGGDGVGSNGGMMAEKHAGEQDLQHAEEKLQHAEEQLQRNSQFLGRALVLFLQNVAAFGRRIETFAHGRKADALEMEASRGEA